MIKIRLQRAGRRHVPLWRVVATDHRAARDGRAVEILGQYDPRAANDKKLNVKIDRIRHWLKTGAQCSETMGELLGHLGIDGRGNDIPPKPWHEKKKKVKPVPVAPAKEVKAEEAPAEEATAEEAPAEEAKVEEAPAEETKVEEAPAEEPKAEEAPAEEEKTD
ncbi:MAG: 30S ribosomal protein S16 [Phycisphaerae bacterium]|nr:30S ribosomal protein S16 [Phycisphaerae bacterium]